MQLTNSKKCDVSLPQLINQLATTVPYLTLFEIIPDFVALYCFCNGGESSPTARRFRPQSLVRRNEVTCLERIWAGYAFIK